MLRASSSKCCLGVSMHIFEWRVEARALDLPATACQWLLLLLLLVRCTAGYDVLLFLDSIAEVMNLSDQSQSDPAFAARIDVIQAAVHKLYGKDQLLKSGFCESLCHRPEGDMPAANYSGCYADGSRSCRGNGNKTRGSDRSAYYL